jgi:glycerate 2-kinase
MNILLASNPHKDYFSSTEINNLIGIGITNTYPDISIREIPVGDGGGGTIESIIRHKKGDIIKTSTYDSLFRKIYANIGIFEDDKKTAVIEIAEACGSHLLKLEERNTMVATSYGVGELIKVSLDMDCKRIIIGLGGCMSSDGGMGMAQSLGARFFDKNNKIIEPIGNSGYNVYSIPHVDTIDLSSFDRRIWDVDVIVAADVTTPLFGENGQAKTFGKQKGAKKDQVEFIETCLIYWNGILCKTFGRNYNVEFSGAAGGLGAGIAAFLKGRLNSGFNVFCEYTNFLQDLAWSNVVVTGEGSLDKTSFLGKAPISIAKVAKKYNKDVFAVVGLSDANINTSKIFNKVIQFGPCKKQNCESPIVESGKKIANIIKI